jgi:hypothetical protein
VFLALTSLLSVLAGDAVQMQGTAERWQAYTYPKIGLKIQIPKWKADIEDGSLLWSFLGYPLVENPVADVQYRVVISAYKYTESQYLRVVRYYSTNNAPDWSNSEHLQTSQMTNEFWIYSRRHIYRTNAACYSCTGRIKRDAHMKPRDVHRLDGEEAILAAEVRRVLDSIVVLSTNSAMKP